MLVATKKFQGGSCRTLGSNTEYLFVTVTVINYLK